MSQGGDEVSKTLWLGSIPRVPAKKIKIKNLIFIKKYYIIYI